MIRDVLGYLVDRHQKETLLSDQRARAVPLFYPVDWGEEHLPVVVFIRQDVEVRRLNL